MTLYGGYCMTGGVLLGNGLSAHDLLILGLSDLDPGQCLL